MNIFRSSRAKLLGLSPGSCDQETLVKRAQVETAIEAVTEGSEVSRAMFSEAEGMLATGQTGLEIAEYRVDPLEFEDISLFASSYNGRAMPTAGLGYRSKTGQAIGEHRTSRDQVFLGLCGLRLEGKTGHRGKAHPQRRISIRHGGGGDKGDLVFESAPNHAALALTTQIGIIDLDFAFQRIARHSISHGLQQFVLNLLGRGVARAQLTSQGQRRQSAGLGLTDTRSLEPRWSAATRFSETPLRRSARCYANKRLMRSLAGGGVSLPLVCWHGTLCPMGWHDVQGLSVSRLPASSLGTVFFEKYRHSKSRLKFDSVCRHGDHLIVV